MEYDLDFLIGFDGSLKPSQINLSSLVNVTEKHVSQHRYYYQSSLNEESELIIEFKNTNLPHLLNLSSRHHCNLPTYTATEIFQRIKGDWDLDYLIAADEQWFSESQDKLIGVLFLYQIFHIQECKAYTPNKIINSVHGSRFKRDNIYFVIFKSANGKVYSVELSETESSNVYTPKSMKINDSHLDKCSEIEMTFIRAERIRPPRKRKNKKTRK